MREGGGSVEVFMLKEAADYCCTNMKTVAKLLGKKLPTLK